MKSITKLHNIACLALLAGLIISLLPVSCFAALSVAPSQIVFVLASPPQEDILADKVVTLQRNGNGNSNDVGKQVYYWATELSDSQGHIIAPELLMVQTPYDSAWQQLSNDVLFLDRNASGAELRFKLDKAAWGPKGTYKGWLRSSAGQNRDIRVVVVIKSHLGITLDGAGFEVEADTGPKTYEAKAPVRLIINANHRNWQITVSMTQGLKYIDGGDGSTSSIDQENMFLAVNSNEFVPLTQGIILTSETFGAYAELDLRLKARTEWKHTAGTYSGTIELTVSESCHMEEDWPLDQSWE